MVASLQGWTILFDLDGTLVDTAPDLLNATNHVLKIADRGQITLPQLRRVIGSGAKAMIRQGFVLTGEPADEREVDALWDPFIAHYTANITAESQLFPGCLDILNALISAGATLAVCTNKQQKLADQVLRELEIAHLFKTCVGADSVANRKPHGDHILHTVSEAEGHRTQSIMIGDSQTDEKAAQNAGLPFIFVPFGYGPGTRDQVHAAAVVEDYSEMLSAIAQITGP